MIPTHCYFCNDQNHFRSAVDDSRRILNYLRTLNNRLNNHEEISDIHLRNDFSLDQKHIHFMCGTCLKVNTSELRTVENGIVSELLKFCNKINEIDVSDYHLVLRQLQGYYPLMYKTLERYFYKTRKET